MMSTSRASRTSKAEKTKTQQTAPQQNVKPEGSSKGQVGIIQNVQAFLYWVGQKVFDRLQLIRLTHKVTNIYTYKCKCPSNHSLTDQLLIVADQLISFIPHKYDYGMLHMQLKFVPKFSNTMMMSECTSFVKRFGPQRCPVIFLHTHFSRVMCAHINTGYSE